MLRRDMREAIAATRDSLRVERRISRYRSNPTNGARRADALRAVTSEENVASRKQIAASRRNIKKAQAARKRRGRGRRAASASANPRKRKKTRRAAASANPRRKRRRAAASAAANPRPRRKRRRAAASAAANPRPRRKRRRSQASSNSWYKQPIRHRKAAKKGIRRKKAKAARRRGYRTNPATPATNINVTATAPSRGNPWYGQPIRHRKAALKGLRRKARKGKGRGKGKKRCPPCRPRRSPGSGWGRP